MIRDLPLTFRRPLTLVCALWCAAQLAGCALNVDPEATSAPAQRASEAMTEAPNLAEAEDSDVSADLEGVDEYEDGSNPAPWSPGDAQNSGDPNPLPWQPDPLPWQPRDPRTASSPEQLSAPGDAPSSEVTQRVEAAIDDR